MRQTEADRELETWVVMDRSASLDFGTANYTKRELALIGLAAVGFLTARTGNRMGAVLTGSDGPPMVMPARGGRAHLMGVLHRALRREPETKSAGRPVTIKLTGFGEARVIGEKYHDGQSVIMDMTEMADADARRLVDFAAGLAFAMRGSIDKVTTKVFMLLPSDIDASDISAEQRRELAGASSR